MGSTPVPPYIQLDFDQMRSLILKYAMAPSPVTVQLRARKKYRFEIEKSRGIDLCRPQYILSRTTHEERGVFRPNRHSHLIVRLGRKSKTERFEEGEPDDQLRFNDVGRVEQVLI